MTIKVGDEVEFQNSTGLKRGIVKRKSGHTLFVRVIFSKWSARTYKLTKKDIISCNLCIERH